ncbi:MAG: VWA domain-containing protein [Meiothermus ruber]|uniref:VWA domain-containing protein n=1 Tax=Meiothermus ruber TaxID=277 RepID=UPI0023F88FB4|nr:VWA domain-containing protein [Meiothermus ruber]MCL6529834.1 VWA domain-containing protein [Meiothermus ruber]
MSFQSPAILLLLLGLPLLIWVYRSRSVQSGSSAYALLPGLSQLRQVQRDAWKRHLGAGLYLLALALGIVALARPQATLRVPDNLAGVMLAMDVSGSMRASDIPPSRLEAAQKAAQDFVRALPEEAKVGLVSFAGYATLEVPLTTDHQSVIDRIALFQLARGTAIGEGLLESLKAFPADAQGKPLGPSTIVLLSDGRSNRGTDPLEAAQKAKQMGVKVHTIGLGKPLAAGEVPSYLAFDEEALRAIAEATGGQYYTAESVEALQAAYRKLQRAVGWKLEHTEVTGVLGLFSGLLLASSLIMAQLRRRVV